MGTVMTYAGWGAIIAGSMSVLFNSLACIKKLFASGKKGMLELKDRFKKFFSRSSKVDVDAPNAPTIKDTV